MSALNRFSKLTMSMLMRYGRKSSSIQTSVRNCSRSGAPAADSAVHRPSNFDRRVLVWSRQFEHYEDIPEKVTVAQMKKAKDYFRIRVNVLMMIAAAFGCVVMVIIARNLRFSGESLSKIDARWQADLKAKHAAEQEQKQKEQGSS